VCVALLVLSGILAGPVRVQPSETRPSSSPVQPHRPATWVWEPDTSLEWAEPLATAGGPAVLAATSDGQLHLVDAKTGHSPLSSPVQAGPGVRRVPNPLNPPADAEPISATPATDPLAYCFDRFAVYAIELSPQPRLRWRVGSWPAGLVEGRGPVASPENRFQGDPEQLRRIVATHAVTGGVLVLQDDGRLALLDARDGLPRWQCQLQRIAAAIIVARGHQAVVVYKSGPRFSAVRVDTLRADLRPVEWPPTAGFPTWSAAWAGGAILLAPPNSLLLADLHRQDSGQTQFRLRPLLPTTFGVILSRTATLADGADPLLVLAASPQPHPAPDSRQVRLYAVDPTRGQIRWAVDPCSGAADLAWCRCINGIVIAAGPHSATLWSAPTGAALGRFDAEPACVLADAGPACGGIWLAEAPDPIPAHPWELRLRFWAGPESVGHPAAVGSAAATTGRQPDLLTLGLRGQLLGVIWQDETAVVVTRAGLYGVQLR
jgi:hypothetical protein